MDEGKLSPISLVLYLVIYSEDPRERINEIANLFIEQSSRGEITALVREINQELEEPTQRVSETLPFVHSPSEEAVREFLHGVSMRFEEHLNKPHPEKEQDMPQREGHLETVQQFEGPCSVCGKPGRVQQIPGVPASSCFCEDHVPTRTIRPIHVFIAVILLCGIGWLIYSLVV